MKTEHKWFLAAFGANTIENILLLMFFGIKPDATLVLSCAIFAVAVITIYKAFLATNKRLGKVFKGYRA